MLSGAGLLVVLPVVARDSVSGVLRTLLIDGIGVADIALVIAVVAMLAVPVVALWLLFAVLAGSSVAVIVAAFSGRFRSLNRIP